MSNNFKNPLDHNIFPIINFDKNKDIKIGDMSESFEHIIDGIYSKFKDNTNKTKYYEKNFKNTCYPSSKMSKIFTNKNKTNLKKNNLSNHKLTYDNLTVQDTAEADYNKINDYLKNKLTKTATKLSNLDNSITSIVNNQLTNPATTYNETINKFTGFVKSKNRFSMIYNTMNDLGKEYNKISTKLGKSVEKLDKDIYLFKNKEKFEQNKLFGGIKTQKIFIMKDEKKETFENELSKKFVLKEYELINILKDSQAGNVFKKYINKNGINAYHENIRFKKNHEKILSILDSISIKKKYL